MKNKYRKLVRLAALVALAVIGFAFSGTDVMAQPQKGALTREDSQGVAWVTITYLNPMKGLDEKELVFDVGMGTHSVDLDSYDFAEVMFLRDDKGATYKAIGAEGLKGGGHHRGGTVRFSGVREDGTNILQGAKYFEILVKGVADVPERVLRWELPIQ